MRRSKIGFTLLCLMTCATILGTRSVTAKPKNCIIDTDAGADDAFAILFLLAYEAACVDNDFKIVGITCVYGNTHVDNVVQNVLKTLTIANRSDIPVYKGTEKPLMTKYISSDYFGHDGFGDFTFDEEIIAKVDKSKYASVALLDLVKQYSDVSILSIGPLTNIAVAMELDSSFVHNVKEFYVMGSSVHGVGNRAPNVEFNFSQDPESNFITLNSTAEGQCTVLPWETAYEAATSMEWRTNVLGKTNSRFMNFLNQAERVVLENTVEKWNSADSLMAAAMVHPELIQKSVLTNVNPVYDGKGRGSVLVDYLNKTQNVKNVQIIQKVNLTMYQDLLLRYLS